MLDRVAFLVGEAIMALRRNGWMTFAAVTTVAVSLFLVGGLGYGYVKLDELAKTISGSFEIRAFMKNGATKEEIKKTAEKMRAVAGVQSVFWIPKEHAWEKMQKDLDKAFRDVENPLPDAFKVTLKDVDKGPDVEAALSGIPELQEVAYEADVQQFLTKVKRAIQVVGFTVVGLLVLTAGVLIFNAIRMTIVSRRREIRIMQLVGAPYMMMRIPFLIEGAVQGAAGGFLATLLLWPCHNYLASQVWETQSTVSALAFPLWNIMLLLGASGAVYGLTCSAFAVLGPMKLQRSGM